jgi:hypothetical protein
LNELIAVGPNQKQDGKPNKKSRLGSTRNKIGQTSHSTIERKNWHGKNKYQGARAQNEDLISELIRPP